MRTLTLIICLSLITTGCSYLPKVRKLDVQQGNIITEQDVGQLKPGMSTAEAKSILGIPLLISPYKDDPYYYVYTMQKSGGIIEKQHVVLYFTADQLVNIVTIIPPAAVGPTAPVITSPLDTTSTNQTATTAEAAIDNAALEEKDTEKKNTNAEKKNTPEEIEQYQALKGLDANSSAQRGQNLPSPFGT